MVRPAVEVLVSNECDFCQDLCQTLYFVQHISDMNTLSFQRIQVEDNLSTCYGAAVRENASRNYSITV